MLIRLSPLFDYFKLWCENPGMQYFLARLMKPVFNAFKVVGSCTLKHFSMRPMLAHLSISMHLSTFGSRFLFF